MKQSIVAVLASAALGVVGGVSCCIARGSRVRTPTGLRPIEDLGPGDAVLAVDPRSHEVIDARLIATRSARRETVLLCGEGFALRCTTDHPLWDPDAKVWADAGDWALGRRVALLYVAEDRTVQRVAVERVTHEGGVVEVFDLSVDHPVHTFVADGIVVHNKPPPFPPETCLTSHTSPEFCACGSSVGVVCTDAEGRRQGPCRCESECRTSENEPIFDGQCACPAWEPSSPSRDLGTASCGTRCVCLPVVPECRTPSGEVLAVADGGRFQQPPPVPCACGAQRLGVFSCSDPGPGAQRHVSAVCRCTPDCSLSDGGPVIEALREPCRCAVDGGTAAGRLTCASTSDGGRAGTCACATDGGP